MTKKAKKTKVVKKSAYQEKALNAEAFMECLSSMLANLKKTATQYGYDLAPKPDIECDLPERTKDAITTLTHYINKLEGLLTPQKLDELIEVLNVLEEWKLFTDE